MRFVRNVRFCEEIFARSHTSESGLVSGFQMSL